MEHLLASSGVPYSNRTIHGDRPNQPANAGQPTDEVHARWAVEDAWRASLVQQRWARFARQLSAAQCEALLVRAAARKLAAGGLLASTEFGATDGWNLATRGYVPHAANVAASNSRFGPPQQRQLAW